MFASEEEARAHVRAQVETAAERQGKAQQMAQEMAAIAVSATSSRREVTVTLGQGGNVTDVSFDRIDGLDAAQLGAAVMEANRGAQHALLARIEQLSETYYGKKSATTDFLTQQYRSMLPDAVEAQPPAGRAGPELGGTR